MSVNKIYLHVGMQKTATSSIQSTLHANRELMRQNSFLYPECWSNWHAKEIGALLHTEKEEERRNILLRKEFTEEIRRNLISTLKTEMVNSDCENLLISAENIILFSYEGVERLKSIIIKDLKVFDIKIVISTRQTISFINSIVQQIVKSSFKVDYKEIQEKYSFYNQIQKFAEVFGKENLIVYDFESAINHPFGVIGCFLENIGFNKKSLKYLKVMRANEGISDVACEIIDFINTNEPFIHDNNISKKRFAGDTKKIEQFSGQTFVIESNIQKEIIKSTLSDRVWLKENYSIDYLNIKPTKNKKVIFDDRFYNEFISIYPYLHTEIRVLLSKYIKNKISTESIFNIKNKKTLKKILRNL